MTENAVKSRVANIFDRLLSEAVIQSVTKEVGNKVEQATRETARHFAGIGMEDEHILRNAEEEVERELIGVEGHDAVDIRDKINNYRQWLMESSKSSNSDLEWRAREWGLIVTTGTSTDKDIGEHRKNIIRGLVMCQDDEERERYLMSIIIEKPISLKIIDWFNSKKQKCMAWLHEKFGPDIANNIWNRIIDVIKQIWNNILEFVGDDFIPWLMNKEVETDKLQKKYHGWLKKNGGISLFGNWMTNGPFFKVKE